MIFLRITSLNSGENHCCSPLFRFYFLGIFFSPLTPFWPSARVSGVPGGWGPEAHPSSPRRGRWGSRPPHRPRHPRWPAAQASCWPAPAGRQPKRCQPSGGRTPQQRRGARTLGPRELAPSPRGVWNPQPPQTTCLQSQARWSPGDTGRRCAALGTRSGAYAAPLPWGLLLGLDELGRVLFHPDRPDWPVSCRPPAAPHGRGGARWPTLRWSCGLRWAHPSSFGWEARSLRLVHPPHGKFAPEPARAARRGTARLQPARKRRDGRPGRPTAGDRSRCGQWVEAAVGGVAAGISEERVKVGGGTWTQMISQADQAAINN